jgi:hypothetical protein
LERGREYAETIRRRTADLRRACDESRDPVRSALAALKLAEAWMQLRADALFARSVRAREASLARFPWQSAVSDDEIRTALRTYATQAEAAQALGIEARQIRNRIPLAERKAIAKYKKR